MASDYFTDLGFAKLDLSRSDRTGMSETVFCPGKTKEQLSDILKAFSEKNKAVLGTKCSLEQYEYVAENLPEVHYDPVSKILCLQKQSVSQLNGMIAVCTAGTADLPIAQEAAQTAEFFGAKVDRHFDVGVAGIHRLFAKIENIRQADVIIAVAGMEGALPGVIAGLTDKPVIAVPTSVGYGASFSGLSALLTMLNSCAEGISVVNIDNGFGAGVLACRIIRLIERK